MLTEKDYCDYETCVALRELGYDDSTDLRYNDSYSLGDFLSGIKAPTLYEAQKWLREEKGILLQPTYLELSDEWVCVIRDKNKRHGYSVQKQKNYEEALSEGIKEAVKILKDGNNN